MIQRLTEVTLRDFRCYRTQGPISLDADIVVIYGSNGSGKTSLFSALEYALTGSVGHLEAYHSDYPRCLQHVRASDPASVSIAFQDDGVEQRIVRSLKNSDKPAAGNNLGAPDVQFLRERCYLSQDQLSRMFDSYTDGSKRDQDQPLVRFARELLSLDSLENITDGLHVALDLRRLDKANIRFRELREELDRLPAQHRAILEELSQKKTAFRSAVTILEDLFRGRLGPHALVQWNESTLKSQRASIEDEAAKSERQTRVSLLQRFSGSLATATRLLESAQDSAVESKDFLLTQLKTAEQEQRLLRLTVVPAIHKFESILGAHFPSEIQNIPDAAPEQRLANLETAAKRSLQIVETRLTALADAKKERSAFELRQTEVGQELDAASGHLSAEASRLQEWLRTLTAVAQHLDGDQCPVCSRDYAELEGGTLRQKIETEIARLGGNAKQLNERAGRRARQQAELTSLSTQILVLTERIAREDVSLALQAQVAGELQALVVETLPSLASNRTRLSELANVIHDVGAKKSALDRRVQQQEEVAKQIAEMADQLKVPLTPILTERAQALRVTIQKELDELVQAESEQDKLITALRHGEQTLTEQKGAERRLLEFETKRRQVDQAWKSANGCITQAKQLADAATNAKKTLLEEVFDGALNDLWTDLFKRLVKSDRFTPQLKLERRGRELRTQITGHADGVNAFDHAGSVLSAGNFNTAALSLFLSVHLLEQPKHQVLLLDDPVQNIDDVHIIQLASLLRTIAFDSKRQIFLGVHERALFDYLCLELGPTKEGQTLLAIEVTGGADIAGAEIHADLRVWENDRLQLGA